MRLNYLILLLLISLNSYADIHYVDDDLLDFPKAQFTTIQDAINAAANSGDQIIVAPGTYTGSKNSCSVIDLIGKSIKIESSEGKEVTFLDGQNKQRVINISSNEPDGNIIKGFTVQNGHATGFNCGSLGYMGGGLFCLGPIDIEIQDCFFKNNHATFGGGLATSVQALAIISNCIFTGNTADANGGGLFTAEISYIDMNSGILGCNSPNDAFGQIIISSQVCNETCEDTNENSIPDSCENAPQAIGDINEDGRVNTADILILISEFGSYSYISDLNVDNLVNTADLLILISNFGTIYPGACCFTGGEEWYCIPDFGTADNCENSGGNFAGPLQDCNGDCWF